MPDLNVSLILRMVDRLSGPLSGAVKGVSDAGKVTATTSAKLTKLGETGKAVAGFTALKTETASTASALQTAQIKVAGISREIRGMEAPAKAVTAAFTDVMRSTATLKVAHGDLSAKTEGARRGLMSMAGATKTLASEQRRLKTEIDAATHAAEREAKAGERMAKIRGLVGGTGGMGGALAGVAGTAGAGLGAKASVNAAGDLEHGLAALGNTIGASDAELSAYRLKILGVSRDVNQSAMALLEGAQILGGKGLDKDAMVAALAPIGKTATATGAAVADLSNTAFSLIDNLKIDPGEMTSAMDMLAKSADLGGFELKNMARYFPMLTSSASQLGIKGKEGIATLGSALQIALKGAADPAEAANNMANFMKAMTTEETAKNFKKHGINLKKSLMSGVAKGENPIEAMMKLIGKATGTDLKQEMDRAMAEKVSSGLDPEAAMKAAADAVGKKFKLGELFNDSQVMNFLGPMLANFQKYKRFKDETLEASGTVDEKFVRMMATWNEQTQGVTIAIGGLSEAVGHALIPVLMPMVKGVADGAVALTGLANAHPQATAGVVGLVGGFMALRTALGVFRLISGVAGVVGMLPGPIGAAARVLPMFGGGLKIAGAALSFVATGIRVVGVALLANPIGLIIAGVAALIAGAAYLIYDNWGTVGPWLGRQLEAISGIAERAWNGLKTVFAYTPLGMIIANWDGIVGWFGGLWDRTKGAVDTGIATVAGAISGWSPLATISSAWSGVTGFIGDVWTGAGTVVSSGIATVTGVVSGWHPLATISTAWTGVTGFIGDVWTGASAVVSSGIATITGVVSGWSPLATITTAWDGVTGYFTGLWADITGIAGRALDWIDQKIQSAIGWITGIRDKIGATVDWVASSLGLSGSSDKPTVAGVAPPQPANLNTPPPANDSRRLPAVAAGGAGPATYALALTFTLNGVISDIEVKRMIEQAKDELERKFAGLVRETEARRAALHD